MAFTYNDEVVDLLLKKTLGTAYTSSTLVPGQETPLLQRIQNNQIVGVGYYNTWANLKMGVEPNRCAFTRHMKKTIG